MYYIIQSHKSLFHKYLFLDNKNNNATVKANGIAEETGIKEFSIH